MRFKKVDQLPNKNRTFVEFKSADIKVDDFEKRLEATLEKLLAGKQNPSEK
jgi:hypothetical protein